MPAPARLAISNNTAMEESVAALLPGLADHQHLARDRALKQLQSLLNGSLPSTPVHASTWAAAQQLLQEERWEAKLGGLKACMVSISTAAPDGHCIPSVGRMWIACRH